MAKDIVMQRAANGSLVPTDQMGIEYIQSLKVGKALGVTVVQARNYKFHRKLIALLKFCFDTLPNVQVEYKGEMVGTSFKVFRRYMVAMAGYHTSSATPDGNLRIEAQSISYSECSEELAQEIYSSVLDVAMKKLGEHQHRYTREGLDNIVNELLEFDG